MYQQIIESLGFSPNEARIYESLVESGEATVSQIAVHAQIHRRNAYDGIKRLIEKGLVFELFSGSGSKYNAVEPDKLMEFLAEKTQSLQNILPDLKRKFHQRLAPEEAYIYRGLEGQKNVLRDILRVGEDSYVIGAKGDWADPRLATAVDGFFKETNKKHLKFNIIYDYEVKKHDRSFLKKWPGQLRYRFLPEAYSSNSLLHVFGDYVITYSGLTLFKTPDNIVIFVLHSKDLAESYRKWFWYMWEQSSK